jgi:hypothetical protein
VAKTAQKADKFEKRIENLFLKEVFVFVEIKRYI